MIVYKYTYPSQDLAQWRQNHLIQHQCNFSDKYRQTSNISDTLAGSKKVDYWDVVGASPVGTAPTTSSFST